MTHTVCGVKLTFTGKQISYFNLFLLPAALFLFLLSIRTAECCLSHSLLWTQSPHLNKLYFNRKRTKPTRGSWLHSVLWLGGVDTQGAVKRPEHTLLTQTLLTQSLGQSRTQSCWAGPFRDQPK